MAKLLTMHRTHWAAMRSHMIACAPLEGCGLLAGLDGDIREVIPVSNGARSPTRFRMEAAEQLRAFNHIEDSGQELLGIFHSHPGSTTTASQPSPTDIEEAAYPVVHIIWSPLAGVWTARGYWIADGVVDDVRLHVMDEK